MRYPLWFLNKMSEIAGEYDNIEENDNEEYVFNDRDLGNESFPIQLPCPEEESDV